MGIWKKRPKEAVTPVASSSKKCWELEYQVGPTSKRVPRNKSLLGFAKLARARQKINAVNL
jgi:hypothetical protein